MAIDIGSGFITVTTDWTTLKSLVWNKNMVLQFDDDGHTYTLFAIDSAVVYVAKIYQDGVPYGSGVDATQNSTDKTDFETNYKTAASTASIIPRAPDGKENSLPNLFPVGTQVTTPGAGDSSSVIGAGTDFSAALGSGTAASTTVSWTFKDPVWIAGGAVNYQNAVYGDNLNYQLVAAATTTTSGGGTGNCNLTALGGGKNMIVPSNGAGSYNLNAWVPVPNTTMTGHWDWVAPSNGIGAGTLNPNYNGTGQYDLYDFQVTLGNLLGPGYKMMGAFSLDFTIPAIVPKKLLPQWTHSVVINTVGQALRSQLQIVWALKIARYKTA